MASLRRSVLAPLLEPDPALKAALTTAIDTSCRVDAASKLDLPAGIPGRPARPRLVRATELKVPSLRTAEGRAALIHSIVHIEMNAVDLALDAVARFADMPDQFYVDWTTIAKEEALHFT